MRDDLSSDLASLRIDRGRKPERRTGKILIWTAVPVALGLVGYFGVVPYLAKKVFKREVQVTEIVEARPGQAKELLVSTGYVKPQRTSLVAPKVTGKVVEVGKRQGDTVKAGDMLLVLDITDQQAAVASAQARAAAAAARVATARANLAEIKLQAERAAGLAEKGVRPAAAAEDLGARVAALQQQVRAAEAELRANQAEVKALQVGLGNYTLTAPIDGTLISDPPEIGEIVAPQAAAITTADTTSVIEIADFSTLAVETDVPESRLDKLTRADGKKVPCDIVLDAFSDRSFLGEVIEIVPRVNRAKATVTVKVGFRDPPTGVLPDMAARVRFLAEDIDPALRAEGSKILVPQAAVVDRDGGKAVYVVEDGKVRVKQIKASGPSDGFYVIEEGPPVGTRVVKSPPGDLADGESVKERTDG